MTDAVQVVLITIAGLALAALISFGFAVAGAPQEVWLWHDVLGLL